MTAGGTRPGRDHRRATVRAEMTSARSTASQTADTPNQALQVTAPQSRGRTRAGLRSVLCVAGVRETLVRRCRASMAEGVRQDDFQV
jgi:hypothetical protein